MGTRFRGALRKDSHEGRCPPKSPKPAELRGKETYQVLKQFQSRCLGPGETGQQGNTETQRSRLRKVAFVKDDETRSCPAFILTVSLHMELNGRLDAT